MRPRWSGGLPADAVWLAVGRDAAEALERHGEGLLGADRPPIRCVEAVHEGIAAARHVTVEACVVSASALEARPHAALETLKAAIGAAPLLVHESGRPDPAIRRAARDLGVPVWELGGGAAVATAVAEPPRIAPDAAASREVSLPRADDDAPPADAVDAERFVAGCLERIGRFKALVSYILRTLAEASSASRISVMLRTADADRDELKLTAARGLRPGLAGRVHVGLGVDIAGRVAALGRPTVGRAARGGRRDYPGTAYAVLPLGSAPDCEGVVGLTGLPGDRLPSDEALRAWRRLCRHAGLALRGARELRQARRAAAHDPLTGLPNRRSFDNALHRELRRAERDGSTVVVAMFDVDRFKSVNDHHGHDAGDEVLKEVARRLAASFRDTDLVARWGGEEFAVLLPGLGQEARASEEPQRLLERARAAIRGRGVRLGRAPDAARVTISGGYAVFREHGVDAATLVKLADDALRKAKDTGRDRVLRAAGG